MRDYQRVYAYDYQNVTGSTFEERRDRVFELLWKVQTDSDWFYGFAYNDVRRIVEYVNLVVLSASDVVITPKSSPSWFGLVCTGGLLEWHEKRGEKSKVPPIPLISRRHEVPHPSETVLPRLAPRPHHSFPHPPLACS
eukprot:1194367-Prorocentrum_minimum.AAC.5